MDDSKILRQIEQFDDFQALFDWRLEHGLGDHEHVKARMSSAYVSHGC
jgi:hypothetical protein